jgi:hypothetical protein
MFEKIVFDVKQLKLAKLMRAKSCVKLVSAAYPTPNFCKAKLNTVLS